jgi:hypothetical protein
MFLHGIVPYVHSQTKQELKDKMFSLQVDESTYHGKVRLEFWITFITDDMTRKNAYL